MAGCVAYVLHGVFWYPTSEKWLPAFDMSLPIYVARIRCSRWGRNWGKFERLGRVDLAQIDKLTRFVLHAISALIRVRLRSRPPKKLWRQGQRGIPVIWRFIFHRLVPLILYYLRLAYYLLPLVFEILPLLPRLLYLGFIISLLVFEWGTTWPFFMPSLLVHRIPFASDIGSVIRNAVLPTIISNFQNAKKAAAGAHTGKSSSLPLPKTHNVKDKQKEE
ncbi:hypothetical protein K439DRAFT_1629524 [Ramaria rubella]|nr:hypothetical protein K439DRAFT_1629524 [Ramaria rubella]